MRQLVSKLELGYNGRKHGCREGEKYIKIFSTCLYSWRKYHPSVELRIAYYAAATI